MWLSMAVLKLVTKKHACWIGKTAKWLFNPYNCITRKCKIVQKLLMKAGNLDAPIHSNDEQQNLLITL